MHTIQELTDEAASLLEAHRARKTPTSIIPIHDLAGPNRPDMRYGKMHFGAAMAISPARLARPMEYFVELWLSPLMAQLASKIPPGTVLAGRPMELPVGLSGPQSGAALSYYNGVSVRGILTEALLDEPALAPWHETKRFYNIRTDEMELGPVGLILRFDCFEPWPESPPQAMRDHRGRFLARALKWH